MGGTTKLDACAQGGRLPAIRHHSGVGGIECVVYMLAVIQELLSAGPEAEIEEARGREDSSQVSPCRYAVSATAGVRTTHSGIGEAAAETVRNSERRRTAPRHSAAS